MTILAGQLLLSDIPGRARIAPGYIRIDGEHIAEVCEGKIPDLPDAGGPDTLIAPGFIDAHLHLSQFDMIGAHGMPLLDWLNEVTFPTERGWSDDAEQASRRALQQCLAFGTTGICAYASTSLPATTISLQQATKLGIRGVIGNVLMDRNAPESLLSAPDDLRVECIQALTQFPPNLRMSAAVTPRFAITCTPELLRAAGKVAKEHAAVIQTHLAETERECERVSELFDGKKYVDVYHDAGLLGPKTILGHGIHLDTEDHQTLAEHRCVVAHCPTANSFLRSGTMNRQALLAAGVSIALGSDVGAGYERSMVRVARAMIEAASSIGDDFPSAAEAWYQITAGNADALGWSDAGHLRVGDPADVVVIQPDVPWLHMPVDPLAALMWQWDDRWLKSVYTLGQQRHG